MIYVRKDGDDENNRKRSSSSKKVSHVHLAIPLHDFLFNLGFKAERRGELNTALDLYANAVVVEPNSALSWYNYGDVLLALGRLEESVIALTKAVELAPGNALYHYDLGLAYFNLRRYDAAANEFMAITAIDPTLKRASSTLVLSAMTNLALSLESQGNVKAAIDALSPAVKLTTNVLYNMGRFHAMAKSPVEALAFAQAAAALDQQSEDAVHLCGRTLMDLGRESEALDYLRKATQLDPKCMDAWYDLGVTLARLGKRPAARTCFRKLIRMAPNYTWAYYDLACLDALEGRVDRAFAQLEKAVSLGFNAIAHLRKDTDLRSLRKDARWRVIQKGIQLNLNTISA